jgi:hypothetical protein
MKIFIFFLILVALAVYFLRGGGSGKSGATDYEILE